MGKFDKWLIAILALAIAYAVAATIYARSQKSEVERLGANQKALLDKAAYYETEAGLSAASVERLTLSYDELKAHYGEVCKAAEDMGAEVKRLQAASRTAMATNVKIATEVKDSIVYRDRASPPDTIKGFRWSDPWVSVDGTLANDSIAIGFCSVDTLIQVVHRVPKKFWFIKYGTKAIRQEVRSSNPHSNIVYSEYLELKK